MPCNSQLCYLLEDPADLVTAAATATWESLEEFTSYAVALCPFPVRAVDENGRTILHMAASCGKNGVIEWVLSEDKDSIGYKDCNGWTPLHRAVYFGYIDASMLLINHGANLYTCDIEGFDPLELIHMDICRAQEKKEKKQINNLFVWGVNSNFNLGQGNANSREKPELLMELWKNQISVQQVAISKFHSVILTECGHVYSCGHGRGGRLGHGSEDTVLYPKQVKEFKSIHCTMVAAANDHSLFLDELGQVYSCGLNSFHQLGIIPSPKQCLSPTQIFLKSLKGKWMVGIAAARFHSVMYTESELYTFGMNAGQLGHVQGDDFQTVPKLVTSIQRKQSKINTVVASDGATLCALSNGDIYILQKYICRRIAARLLGIGVISCSGGVLDDKFFKNTHFKDPEPLQISVLLKGGSVLHWHSESQNFKSVYFGPKFEMKKVIDISQGKILRIVTDDGLVYECTFKPLNKVAKGSPLDVNKKQTTSTSSLQILLDEQKRLSLEQQHAEARRVRLLYNAHKIFSDPKSRNVAVIQGDRGLSTKDYPTVSKSTVAEDMKNLLEEADLTDDIHDMIIKGPGFTIPCHRFILSERIPNFKEIQCREIDGIDVIDLSSSKFAESKISTWLREVYQGNSSSNLLAVGTMQRSKSASIEEMEDDNSDEDLSEDLIFSMKGLLKRDMDYSLGDDAVLLLNDAGLRKRNNCKKVQKERSAQNTRKTKKKDRKHSLKSVGFSNWKARKDASDIEILSSDNMSFRCHKCILVGRLEYFNSMLSNLWIETNPLKDTIDMPMPGSVLEVLLDFLYCDESPAVTNCKEVEFLWNVIIMADQFWVRRLKEIAEKTLATLVTIKNAIDMLEFSCAYNADQLKVFCCHYISMNMCYFMESRLLDSLSSDSLQELSKEYRKVIPRMDYRVITPSTSHLDQSVPCSNVSEKPSRRSRGQSQKGLGEGRKSISLTPGKVKCEEATNQESVQENEENSAKRLKKSNKSKKKFSDEMQVQLPTQPNGDIRKYNTIELMEEDIMNHEEPSSELPTTTHSAKNKAPAKKEKICRETKEKDPASESKKGKPLNVWGSQSSPAQNSLKSVIEDEKRSQLTEDDSSNEKRKGSSGQSKTRPHSNKKLGSGSKKSQKQRKLELSLSSKGAEAETEQKPPEPKKTICPWASVSSQPLLQHSLKDVIAEELEESPCQTTPLPKKTLPNNASPRVKSGSTWASSNEPLNPSSSGRGFQAIMNRQQDENEELSRRSKKPLPLIQIEEKAIEELLLQYNSRNFGSEYVTIQRVVPSIASPTWDVQRGTDFN